MADRLIESVAAAGWVALCLAAVFVVAAPWRDLGGLVSERLRWLQRFALSTALWLGLLAPSCERRLRLLLYPPAAAAATAMAWLELHGADDAVGVVLSALVSWTAGIGLGFTRSVAGQRPCAWPRRSRRHRGRPDRPSRAARHR